MISKWFKPAPTPTYSGKNSSETPSSSSYTPNRYAGGGGFGRPPRKLGNTVIEEIRDTRGLKMGEIQTWDDGSRIEARDANGIRLGWYLPMYNLTYDARTCCSIAQGNVLTALIMERGTKW